MACTASSRCRNYKTAATHPTFDCLTLASMNLMRTSPFATSGSTLSRSQLCGISTKCLIKRAGKISYRTRVYRTTAVSLRPLTEGSSYNSLYNASMSGGSRGKNETTSFLTSSRDLSRPSMCPNWISLRSLSQMSQPHLEQCPR
jgi:hypothetical protein